MDVNKAMITHKRILTYTITIIIATEIALYVTMNLEKPLLFLFPLLFFIPVFLAFMNLKRLLNKYQGLKIETSNLVAKIEQIESEKREAQHKLAEVKNIANHVHALLFSYEMTNKTWIMSERFLEFSTNDGADLQKGIKIIEDYIYSEDRKYYYKKKNIWLSGVPTTIEFRIVLQNQQIRWYELKTNSINHPLGDIKRIVGIMFDITERKRKEEHLAQMAFYDPLTDLPNRVMLKSHLGKVIARAKRIEHKVTTMFIDLDGFKEVNDTLGHDAGDMLLKKVAQRLTLCLREEDLISRVGGDEFIIVFEETSKDEVTTIAERILQKVSEPYYIFEQKVVITSSIGISIFPEDGVEIATLIKNADKAMYFAKNHGKANYQFYSSDYKDYEPKESFIDKILKVFQK